MLALTSLLPEGLSQAPVVRMNLRIAQLILAGSVAALAGCTGALGSEEDGTMGGSTGGGQSGGSGASSGMGPNGEAGSPNTVVRGIDLPGAPKYYRFVRLTNAQWARSVQDILNLAAPSGIESAFEQTVAGTTDFTNNEHLLEVNQRSWSDFQAAAEELAEQVTASDATLANVYAGTDAQGFITTLGRRAYRRPLTAAEITTYTNLFTAGSAMLGEKSEFAKGAALVIRALLQSPYFLYRSELTASGKELDGYEVAAKLSLWLRNTTPSDALLDMAPSLTTAGAAETLAATMLAESTATAVMRQFHGEFLHLERFNTLSKLNVPSYNESLNAEYKESAYLFFDKIFTQDQGVKAILTSTMGFMGPGMAALYGLPSSGSGFVEKDLGPERVGYFSQLPFLTLNAINDEPDSIHRGVTINLDFLCAPLGPPAAEIPPIPPLQPGQTNRQRIDKLTLGCGLECHNEMINPVGFAFEHFDGMGQYRDTENGGLPIDASGEFDLTEGTVTYDDASGLMKAIGEGEQAHLCYAKKLASFALQRDVVTSDMPLLDVLAKVSMASSGSVKQVMLELVKNDAFRKHVGGAL
jgi:hypothetical protein